MDLDPIDPSLLLPHREPFLLLDRVARDAEGRRATGWKAVTAADCRGGGTWPPSMLLEVMAQTSAVLLFSDRSAGAGKTGVLAGVPEMTFRRPARPGETIVATAALERSWGDLARFDVRARIDDEEVAAGAILLAVMGEP